MAEIKIRDLLKRYLTMKKVIEFYAKPETYTEKTVPCLDRETGEEIKKETDIEIDKGFIARNFLKTID